MAEPCDLSALTSSLCTLALMLFCALCSLYRLAQRRAPIGRSAGSDVIAPPPRLASLPLLGSLPFLPWRAEELHGFLTHKARELGPVFSFQAGPRYTLVLNGRAVILEALCKRDFADRVPAYAETTIWNKRLCGLLSKSYGPSFRHYHHLTVSILRQLGYGGRGHIMQRRLQAEASALIGRLAAVEGGAIYPKEAITTAVFNVIYDVIFGRGQGQADSAERRALLRMSDELLDLIDPVLDLFPSLRFLPRYRAAIARMRTLDVELMGALQARVSEGLLGARSGRGRGVGGSEGTGNGRRNDGRENGSIDGKENGRIGGKENGRLAGKENGKMIDGDENGRWNDGHQNGRIDGDENCRRHASKENEGGNDRKWGIEGKAQWDKAENNETVCPRIAKGVLGSSEGLERMKRYEFIERERRGKNEVGQDFNGNKLKDWGDERMGHLGECRGNKSGEGETGKEEEEQRVEDNFVSCFSEREGADCNLEELTFIARDLIIAGTESVSAVLQWALILLGNHPRVQARLQGELDAALAPHHQPPSGASTPPRTAPCPLSSEISHPTPCESTMTRSNQTHCGAVLEASEMTNTCPFLENQNQNKSDNFQSESSKYSNPLLESSKDSNSQLEASKYLNSRLISEIQNSTSKCPNSRPISEIQAPTFTPHSGVPESPPSDPPKAPTVPPRPVYLEAVVWEVLRCRGFAQITLPHRTARPTCVGRFSVPAHALVLVNLHSVHSDPAVWGEDAADFRPERFLDSEGRLVNSDLLIPFSIGKRACPGRAMALQQLHTLLAALLLHFSVLPPPNHASITDTPVVVRALVPAPFTLRLVPRGEAENQTASIRSAF